MKAQADQDTEKTEKRALLESRPPSPSSLTLEGKIITPPNSRRALVDSDIPLEINVSELYLDKPKHVVCHHKKCHYFWISIVKSCQTPVECPNCPAATVYGSMAFQTTDEAIIFKTYMMHTELQHKMQVSQPEKVKPAMTYAQVAAKENEPRKKVDGPSSSTFADITDGNIYKKWLKWFDVLPVPEVVGLHRHFQITRDWNFGPSPWEDAWWDGRQAFEAPVL